MSSISKIYSAELDGIDARLIEVETDVHVGLHSFAIVGLADKALSEAKERVNAALKNLGVKAPTKENRRIVVNLAPADVKKTGSHYDLAIALGYLVATEQIRPYDDAGRALVVGELALDGNVRPIRGALSIARLAERKKFRALYVPAENAPEAALIPGIAVFGVRTLAELVDHLEGRTVITVEPQTAIQRVVSPGSVDVSEIRGQGHAKRALLISAAGGHNLIMQGPPGTGKSMLAQALASLLPPLSLDEVIEVTQIWSTAASLGDRPYVHTRPFRSPHQTASPVAVVGGGTDPRPGEISLAHRGVLFLDELPEFRRDLLEALRGPMESGRVSVARAKQHLTFPAQFTLVAAMNPCPCGYWGDPEKECACTAFEVFRYRKKVSGPLMDRIDLQIHVPRLALKDLRATEPNVAEGDDMRKRVLRSREVQQARFAGAGKRYGTNAEMSSRDTEKLAALNNGAEEFLKEVFDSSRVSPRGYYRVLKVARTIADLSESESVTRDHIAEAWSYRVREQEA